MGRHLMRRHVLVALAGTLLAGCMDRSPYQTQVYALGGGASGARAIVLDEERLYWTAAEPAGAYGTVMVLPKDGADTASRLFTSAGAPDRAALPELALDGDHLYWVVRDAAGNGGVVRARRDGAGSPAEVVSGLAGPCGVGLDDDSLYYLLVQEPAGPGTGGTVTVCRSPKAQPGPCSVPLATLTLPAAMTANRTLTPPTSCAFVLRNDVLTFAWHVDVTEGAEEYSQMALVRIPVDAPSAMSLEVHPYGELHDGAGCIAASSAVFFASTDNNLYRIDDGGEMTSVRSGFGQPRALAAHGDWLYWLDGERNDPKLFYAKRMRASGGSQESVGMGALHGLAVDADYAYVADGDEMYAFAR